MDRRERQKARAQKVKEENVSDSMFQEKQMKRDFFSKFHYCVCLFLFKSTASCEVWCLKEVL